ncbi:MAG TPA: hypothetical protein VHA53_06885 [Nitrolancea sp.]|nr:hypothetical protein [Nitrolancea sp.]
MNAGSRGLACGCLVLILLLALFVTVGSAVAAPLRTPLLGNLRFRCTLGFERTNASVTMRGPLAGHECRKLLDQTSAFPVRIFTTSNIADAPVVCSFTQSHVKVTVRDDGFLQLLGDNLCTAIQRLIAELPPAKQVIVNRADTSALARRP